jgi:signal transduction histidine kinase
MQYLSLQSRPLLNRLACVLLTMLTYVASGVIGVDYATIGTDTVSAIWPASGIAIAAVFLGGPWITAGVWLGSLVVNWRLVGMGSSLPADVLVVSLAATGAALEAFFGAWLLRRFAPGRDPFATVRGAVVFFAYAVLGSTLIGATLGSLAIVLGGFEAIRAYPEVWFTWWIGDAVGVLVVAPVIILWATQPLRRLPRRDAFEAALFVLVFAAVVIAIFSLNIPLSFLILALMGWLAFRYGRRAASLGIIVSTGVAIVATTQGRTIFSVDSLSGSLLLLQAYILTTTFPILVLAAAMYERQGMQRAMEETNQLLEERVRQRTMQLAEALDRAESAGRARSLFIAEMAHEFRTPLAAMVGYADLLLDGYLGEMSPEQLRAARQINQSAHRLHQLINDTINLSRIEAGSLELKQEPVKPRLFADEIVASLSSLAVQKGIALETQIDEDAPEVVMVDAARLQQVAINLAGNALKFTEAGAVTLRVGRAAADRWTLAVQDTGVGIPADSQESIFESFTRLDNVPPERMPEGSGLGLSITRQLVTLMGGDIRVESQVGRGSTFTVTLPIGGIPAAP